MAKDDRKIFAMIMIAIMIIMIKLMAEIFPAACCAGNPFSATSSTLNFLEQQYLKICIYN